MNSTELRKRAEAAQVDTLQDIQRYFGKEIFYEYGLDFDYIPAKKGHPGYWRFLICTGGPEYAIHFYGTPDEVPYRITFVFKDWFEKYERVLRGENFKLLCRVWEHFCETEAVQDAYKKALSA